MVAFLWKPVSQGGLNPGGTSVLFGGIRGGIESVGVYDSDGNLIEDLTRASGTELGTKFYSRRPGSSFGDNLTVRATYSNGKTEEYQIGAGGQRFEGPLGDANPGASSGSSGGGTVGGGPNKVGDFAFSPANLTGEFPSPSLTSYSPIEAAPYTFTDVLKFAEEYGAFNREELLKNNIQAKQFAMDALNTELEGLQGYAPASAALKRRETSLDNLFNQMERERQVNQALPTARQDISGQRQRALTYASGGIPDEVTDRALEISTRSSAADRASSAGFGGASIQSMKAQDLMSAQERVRLSQYGDQLLSKTRAEEANLFLAPTEYSNAGQQINVMPSLSGSQLQTAARSEITNFTGVPTNQALSSTIQQNQFSTNLEQNTRQFNASNTLQNDQFNAGNINNFALTKFGYQVSLAGAEAGAAQTNLNTQVALQQQQQFQDAFKQFFNKAQSAGTVGSIGQVLGGIVGLLNSLGIDLDLGGAGTEGEGRPEPHRRPPGPGANRRPDDTGGDAQDGDTDSGDSGTEDQEPVETGEDEGPPEPELPGDSPRPPPQETEGEDVGAGEEDTFDPDQNQEDEFDFERSAQVKNFQKDTGLNLRSVPKGARQQIVNTGRAIEQATGTYRNPAKGTVLKGYGRDGTPRFAAKNVANSEDTSLGGAVVDVLQKTLDPLGVFSEEDYSTLQQIKNASSSLQFILDLNNAYASGDPKKFINAIASKFQQPLINALAKDPQNQAGLGAVFGAYRLFENWGTSSNAQKALGIASVGINAFKFATNENLRDKVILNPTFKTNGDISTPGLNVGQALSLFQSGYNVYGLIKNWDTANAIEKINYGLGTATSIANTAQKFGLLNPVSNAGTSAALGGGGAGGGAAGGSTAAGELGLGQALGQAASVAGIALGAYNVYKGWGQGADKGKGAISGAANGAVIVASMYAGAEAGLATWNPYVAAAVFAVSIAGGLVHTGKHEDQMARDGMRKAFEKNGLTKDHKITLADGSTFDIGTDGRGGKHSAVDKSKLVGNLKDGDLHAYDTDYTNDLDYASSMSGIALSRLVGGGKGKNIDQMGGQLGNAGLGDVGFGKNMSDENFQKVMANQRAFYAKAGITNKEEAYKLAKAGFDEGRWNEMDLITMHQAFNMMYDRNGYDTAQRLMGGRHRGLEVAAESAAPENRAPGSAPDPDPQNRRPSGTQTSSSSTPVRRPMERPTFGGRRAILSKEEQRRRNQQRYQTQAA